MNDLHLMPLDSLDRAVQNATVLKVTELDKELDDEPSKSNIDSRKRFKKERKV